MRMVKLSIGPLLFHWPDEKKLEFYSRLASAPVDVVYLGEVVCAKRIPSFEQRYEEIALMLKEAGKLVIFSTLAEVMTRYERQAVDRICARAEALIEANDASVLYHLAGRPHTLGPFLNVYNEDTLEFLAGQGAVHATLPWELHRDAIAFMGKKAADLGLGLEMQVYGRIPLALSARCYHARAHDRIKDNCEYVCAEDADGKELRTLAGEPFLSINGIQTLSHSCQNLAHQVRELAGMGVTHFRLSPHSGDMVETAHLFRAVLDGRISPDEAVLQMEVHAPAPFANGFYHHAAGHRWL